LVVGAFVAFAIVVGVSKYGRIKLGTDDDEPEFGILSWFAMLFAAGMAACDTGDSVMMARLYRWAAGDGGRVRRYNLIVT
ncbi:BCCT family transporter, partial [Mycobacterium tuberculosis]|nr:BCCT family transporter [Mycobacterium tuberculosis]